MNSEKYRNAKEDYISKLKSAKTSGMKFTSVSGEDVNALYDPDDIGNLDYSEDLAFPGQYPFTRGIHTNGYRGKIWNR